MPLVSLIIALVLLYGILTYNTFIKMRNQVKEGWADIDVQLKRRYNLIPNIVESVKGYAAHEEAVFTQVTEARGNAINAGNVHDQASAENMLTGALKSLFAVAENYPDLKANENFMQLQNELVDTEDKIQAARRFYNSIVQNYNTKIQQVPAKIVADMFKFEEEEFFEIEEEQQRQNVQVDFNKGETMQAEAAAPVAAAVATCPKCGGEMTEGHTCPVQEALSEPTPEQAPEIKSTEPAPQAVNEETPAAPAAETSPSEGQEPSQAEASPEADTQPQPEEAPEEKKDGEA